MSNALFLCAAEPHSGKSLFTLGFLDLISSRTGKIAYFKPVISEGKKDSRLETIKDFFKLSSSLPEMSVFTHSELAAHINSGNEALVLDKIISRFQTLQESNDFVLVEGTDFVDSTSSIEFNSNITIAKNLGIPVALIINADGKNFQEISESTNSALRNFKEHGVQVLIAIVNKASSEIAPGLHEKLAKKLPGNLLLSVIPADSELSNPTIKEIIESTEGTLLFGEQLLYNQVNTSIVGAMQLHNCLNRMKRNTLIVTPGDRGDIIIGALQANLSRNYEKIAGLVLTGGLKPEPSIVKLIEGLETVVPIISVNSGTFETVTKIANTRSRISFDNKDKIALAISTFEKHVDAEELSQKIISYTSAHITPRMFQYQIVRRAKSARKHIVLPEGDDDRILQAADALIKQDVVDITVLGNKDSVYAAIKRLNLSLDPEQFSIINPRESEDYLDYVETLYDLRKEKNLSIQTARDLMLDVSYFGTMMVYKGKADGMVSGAAHTTQHTIRPALQFIKTVKGVNTVSSVFFMCLPNRVAVFADCAVNPDPNAEQLADIAVSSAETAFSFGIDPKIAMLSYSSGDSGAGADVDKVRNATDIVRSRNPALRIEGPIQYDAAVDLNVGKKKLPQSEVAGRANVLIFPDLNTGNNTYKAVQRETGAIAIGPILQGLKKPVNDLSRGCTVDDIFNTVVITAIQAQQS